MYDGKGRTVKTLGDEIVLVRGDHTAKWDGKNDSGNSVPIGIYTIQVSAVASDESGTDSKEITVTVAKSLSGGGVGNCFIATAAYTPQSGVNSKLKTQKSKPITDYRLPITVLQQFRDEHLLTNAPGRAFVSTYYKVSPPLAHFIHNKEALKAVTRTYLRPIVWITKKAIDNEN